MRQKLNYELLLQLKEQGKTYSEIENITGYNPNSIYGFFNRLFGKNCIPKKSKQNISLTQEEREILFGTLMGDGNIQKAKYIYTGRINHSLKQYKYCSFKQEKLSSITSNVKRSTVKVKDKYYEICYFVFKANEALEEFYNMFYKNKKKIIPIDLSLLTPRAMAYWFMDDGTSIGRCSISIATCSFTLDDLLRLKQFLKDTYNLEIIIDKEFKLRFPAESGRKFFEIVKDFIIPEMQYKFKDLHFNK